MEVFNNMSKELYLEKAYNSTIVDGVVRSIDDDASFAVIKNGMVDYAKRNNAELSLGEIEDYILKKRAELEAALPTLKKPVKMMK